MIKYFHIPEQHKTIAVLTNTRFDAVNKIRRILNRTNCEFFDESKYLMNNMYRAVVVCHEEDEYSPEEGERRAKDKLLDKYYASLDKRLDKFEKDFDRSVIEVKRYMDSMHEKSNNHESRN